MKTDLLNLFLNNIYTQSFLKPLIISHRGASGYEPENTLRSFKRAIEMGSSMLELDVFLCKSEKSLEPLVVVLHDDTIDRTTNGHGSISELRWETLKKYNAGKGERIPLLSEVFDLIDKRTINGDLIKKFLVIDIELKGKHTAKPVAKLIKYYIKHNNWNHHNFIVSSFDHNAIQEFQNYLPQVKTGLIFFQNNSKDIIKQTRQAHAQYIILDYQSITQNLITKAHSHGLSIFVYTVNDATIAKELATWQIDGIITDYPDILENDKLDSKYLH